MKSWFWIITGFFAAALLATMVSSALWSREGDFLVFYQTGTYLLHGNPVYSLARDGTFCFKYPPWAAPFFMPIALLSLTFAGILWRFVLIAAGVGMVAWTAGVSRNPLVALLTAIAFWGFWLYNVVTGQISTVLVALALFGFSASLKNKFWGIAAMFFGLTAKIFQGFALLAVPRKCWRRKQVLTAILVFTILSLPALVVHRSLPDLIRAYLSNAFSISTVLGGGFYGLPSLFTNLFGLPVGPSSSRMVGFAPSVLIAVAILLWLRGRVSDPERGFAAAIALGTAIHPLPFSYGFIWVYPLAALSMSDSLSVFKRESVPLRRWLPLSVSLLGLFGVVLMNSKYSASVGLAIEGVPTKAIGTLILCAALGLANAKPEFRR